MYSGGYVASLATKENIIKYSPVNKRRVEEKEAEIADKLFNLLLEDLLNGTNIFDTLVKNCKSLDPIEMSDEIRQKLLFNQLIDSSGRSPLIVKLVVQKINKKS